MSALTIVAAQVNPLVGDIDGNTELVLKASREAISQYNADIVLFPELTLTGYPPEDLLLRESIGHRVDRALKTLCEQNLSCAIVVGYPKKSLAGLLNMAGVIHNGKLICEYAKQCLPNYQVFDEKRYFVEGREYATFELNSVKVGLSICEDIWDGEPIKQAKAANVDVLLNLNASPFHKDKQLEREQLVSERAKYVGAPIVYVNQYGGQDELVFDGGTHVADAEGSIIARAPRFESALLALDLSTSDRTITVHSGSQSAPVQSGLATIYDALVLGVKDYVNKNGFQGVVLGLSGGIDSALTLAIAVDALGAERVEAVMMPFRYTSELSKNDAEDEAKRLGVKYRSLSIEPMYEAFMDTLAESFVGKGIDITEQNIQSRSRGVLLMALSNKFGYLVLTTGNKSEMAVGYATIYGDMAGGLDVLKDVPKTMVFELSKYRNTISPVIPESVITRPPSAELAPDQKDEDSLPPYEILDAILEMYIEQDMSAHQIVEHGYEEEVVRRVLRLVDINEYKRRQAPIGIRISRRAFGRDRRYPITNGWKIGD
ncbi:NAD+ synthase [Teredinibacter sp. KSP-S5-2]|uniref:NAD+ synthase n=1 Tax=Teredinibacter sp. KSP-S5-2 TaxID=3034506 RepID=UPI0029346EE5|nr:NAD+ synthase [Teredinibacter sp. KSP-S5-2]WNO09869.1 NAD+ synthase [Teredinibacter sp. KSP-S5-2]